MDPNRQKFERIVNGGVLMRYNGINGDALGKVFVSEPIEPYDNKVRMVSGTMVMTIPLSTLMAAMGIPVRAVWKEV